MKAAEGATHFVCKTLSVASVMVLALSGCVAVPTTPSTGYWAGIGQDIHNTNSGAVGIGTESPEGKLMVISDAEGANTKAIYGINRYPWQNPYGGYFETIGEGVGVFGVAKNKDVTGIGGSFHSFGANGSVAVLGLAESDASNVRNFGGHFDARGDMGVGIWAKGGPRGYAAQFFGNVQIIGGATNQVVLELGEGLDVSEGFPIRSTDMVPPPGTVVIIDTDQLGRIIPSIQAYDRRVAGIVAGARGLGSAVTLGNHTGSVPVALSGRVYCNADASLSAIEPGDLLTTSERTGYAMKASDFVRARGAILGKAMEGLAIGRRGQILVLVTLQ